MIQSRSALASDAAALCAIYNPYVVGTSITFEEEPTSEPEMRRRVEEVTATHPWLVLENDSGLVGYAYATKWRARSAYRYATEATVYLAPDQLGAGYGTRLYTELIEAVKARGLRTLIGGVALPNERSVRLHEKLGFRKVAHFERVGLKFGQWVDVGYWQLTW